MYADRSTYTVFSALLTSRFLFGDMNTEYNSWLLSDNHAKKLERWVRSEDNV